MSLLIIGGKLVNPESLEHKLLQAFETWAREDIDDGYFEDQFKSEKWEYDWVTERKNGTTVGPGPRDIYDLGHLYESGKQNFDVSIGGVGAVASWKWDATNSTGNAYAWYVHEGLSTNLAPRQWTDVFQSRSLFEGSVVHKALTLRIKQAFGK